MRPNFCAPWPISPATALSFTPRSGSPRCSAWLRCSIRRWKSASRTSRGGGCRSPSGSRPRSTVLLIWSCSHRPRSSSISSSEVPMRWRIYWPSFATSLVVAIALLVALTAPGLAGRPSRPDLPDPSRSYPSEYSSAGSDVGHDLLYHGLFGSGAALRHANLFLIGSSHYEFGFSAAALDQTLSKDGQPVRAFNMGLGCGESASFG